MKHFDYLPKVAVSSISALLMLSILFAGLALAQPVDKFPHGFQGSVMVNGAAAPDGVLVSAKVDGKDNAGTLTSGGRYTLIVELKEADVGKTIEFYVQNVKAGQSAYDPGKVTMLDLAATIATPPPSPSGGGPSGGAPSGGGGVTTGPKTCAEDWICTDWNECSNSVQKRVCADVNRCGTTASKPAERQDCVMPVVCTAGEVKCEGDRLVECSGSGTTWLEKKMCELGCSGNTCVEKAASPASASPFGGFPFAGLISAESGMQVYGIVALIVIALVALYFVVLRGRGKGSKTPGKLK